MLTKIRDSSKSLAFYVLGGIVVAVLIISFGTPSVGSLSGGPEQTDGVALKVGGRDVSGDELRQILLLAGAQNMPVEQAKQFRFRERVLDDVIERELLVAEARRLGLMVSSDDAEDFVVQSRMMLFGEEQPLPSIQTNGAFDLEKFRRFLQFYGMTTRRFIEMQQRELAAERVRELLGGTVAVSMQQVEDKYVREGRQVNLEYLRFPIRRYEEELEPGAAEIAAFVAANEDKVKEEYEQKKFLFDKVPKERKLRQIVVRWKSNDEAGKSEARKAADKLADEVRKGKSFAEVSARVRKASPTKDGGPTIDVARLGWRREGAAGLSEEIDKKVVAAKDAELVGPEEGSDGYYLVWPEGTREGALTYDNVKLELGEDLARKDIARKQAERDAEAALERARKAFAEDSSRTLADIFPALGAKAETPVVAGPGVTPAAEETGLFSRRGAVVEGIGVSETLAKDAFDLTMEKPFTGPVEVAGSLIVAKLKERKEADMDAFAATKQDLHQGAIERKGREVASEWVLRQCQRAKQGSEIEVSPSALVYSDGQPGPVPYEPCAPRTAFGF